MALNETSRLISMASARWGLFVIRFKAKGAAKRSIVQIILFGEGLAMTDACYLLQYPSINTIDCSAKTLGTCDSWQDCIPAY